jgi:hypothetical protein
MTPADIVIVRIGGALLLLFLPILLVGSSLFARIGVSSETPGPEALARIAAAGNRFPVMNALFHLGAILLLPGAVSLVIALRGVDRDPWLVMASAFVVVTVVVAGGFVFALNQGLYRVSAEYVSAPPERQAMLGVVAEMNLRTQTGAELVQSLGAGLWLLSVSVATAVAAWPIWQTALGFAGGIGFVAAGLASVLGRTPVVGRILGGLGGLGLMLFAIWTVATGLSLIALQPS